MPNAFDSVNYRTTEPATIVAGDRVAWKRVDLGSDYPPATYDLKYAARAEGSATEEGGEPDIQITATGSGSDFLIEVSKTTTAVWEPGRYHWQAYIVRKSDSERVTLTSGQFEIIANRTLSGDDPRTHVRKVLDAIEAVIEHRATQDQMRHMIAGRELWKTPIPDLLVLRDRYRHELASEETANKIAARLGNPSRMGIRFTRV